jgi:hypothetical protein
VYSVAIVPVPSSAVLAVLKATEAFFGLAVYCGVRAIMLFLVALR